MRSGTIALATLLAGCQGLPTGHPIEAALVCPSPASAAVEAAVPASEPHVAPPVATAPVAPPTRRARIGLALGGGAARGFAHIGVIQVLEENGIHPDVITGTSAGSLVAAMYASGKSGGQLATAAAGSGDAAPIALLVVTVTVFVPAAVLSSVPPTVVQLLALVATLPLASRPIVTATLPSNRSRAGSLIRRRRRRWPRR